MSPATVSYPFIASFTSNLFSPESSGCRTQPPTVANPTAQAPKLFAHHCTCFSKIMRTKLRRLGLLSMQALYHQRTIRGLGVGEASWRLRTYGFYEPWTACVVASYPAINAAWVRAYVYATLTWSWWAAWSFYVRQHPSSEEKVVCVLSRMHAPQMKGGSPMAWQTSDLIMYSGTSKCLHHNLFGNKSLAKFGIHTHVEIKVKVAH